MIVMTSRPAAEPVSSDSATNQRHFALIEEFQKPDDIEYRRTGELADSRRSRAAESHQTRERCATEAPCCARQREVGKEGQRRERAAQKPKGRQGCEGWRRRTRCLR